MTVTVAAADDHQSAPTGTARARTARTEPTRTEPDRTPASRPAGGNGRPGLWAGAAVLAAASAVDPAGLRPFTSLRWLLVGVAVAAGVAALPRRGRSLVSRPELPRWAVAAGAVVVGSMVLAAAFGIDTTTAWLGHPQRHLGVLAWVTFAAAALAGAGMAADHVSIRRVQLAAVGAACVTGAAAVADLLWWSPLGTEFADGRIGGLLGQPTTLAALAVLLLPVTITAPAPRWLSALAATGLVVAVVGSQTRGAFVGLVAVALVSVPALHHPRRRSSPALVAAGAVLIAVVSALSPFGGRLVDSLDSSRPDDWRMAVRVIADDPLLGVGPEGYRVAFPGVVDDAYVAAHGRDVVVDRAHAAPLDVAVSGGVAAGVAYVVLVAGVGAVTWRLQRRRPWTPAASMGAGAVGLLTAGFVAFPTPGVDAVAWLFAGVALATGAGSTAARSAPARSAGARSTRPARWDGARPGLLRAFGTILFGISLLAGVSDVVADRWLADAVSDAGRGLTDEAVASADRATGLRPDLVDTWYVAALVASDGASILDLDAAITRAESGLSRFPRDPALRTLHAGLVTERARRSGLDQDRAEALHTLDSLLADDPTNIEAARHRRSLLDRDDGDGSAP